MFERYFIGEEVIVARGKGEDNLIGEIVKIHTGANAAAAAEAAAKATEEGEENEGVTEQEREGKFRIVERKDAADLYEVKWPSSPRRSRGD